MVKFSQLFSIKLLWKNIHPFQQFALTMGQQLLWSDSEFVKDVNVQP